MLLVSPSFKGTICVALEAITAPSNPVSKPCLQTLSPKAAAFSGSRDRASACESWGAATSPVTSGAASTQFPANVQGLRVALGLLLLGRGGHMKTS